MRYLLAEEILAIHDRIIESIGGSQGLRDENLLRSIAERPRTAFGGNEMYPTLFAKVAAYLEGIAGMHPFIDGNKRTAIATAAVFLHANGVEIELPVNESEIVIIDTAQKRFPIDEIARWLEARTR